MVSYSAKNSSVVELDRELGKSGPDRCGCEVSFRRVETWGPFPDGEELLTDEPRAFVNDFPVVLLEFEFDKEIIQAKINTLKFSLKFPYCSNHEVKVLESEGSSKWFDD